MSAGVFVRAKYQATYNIAQIHPIRVQPETIAADIGGDTNDEPTPDLTSPISAQVSRGRRAAGLHPRIVTAQLIGSAPTGYKSGSIIRIPALTPNFANVALPGVTLTYLGTTWSVISVSPEVTR